eukprot:ctg_616.g271
MHSQTRTFSTRPGRPDAAPALRTTGVGSAPCNERCESAPARNVDDGKERELGMPGEGTRAGQRTSHKYTYKHDAHRLVFLFFIFLHVRALQPYLRLLRSVAWTVLDFRAVARSPLGLVLRQHVFAHVLPRAHERAIQSTGTLPVPASAVVAVVRSEGRRGHRPGGCARVRRRDAPVDTGGPGDRTDCRVSVQDVRVRKCDSELVVRHGDHQGQAPGGGAEDQQPADSLGVEAAAGETALLDVGGGRYQGGYRRLSEEAGGRPESAGAGGRLHHPGSVWVNEDNASRWQEIYRIGRRRACIRASRRERAVPGVGEATRDAGVTGVVGRESGGAGGVGNLAGEGVDGRRSGLASDAIPRMAFARCSTLAASRTLEMPPTDTPLSLAARLTGEQLSKHSGSSSVKKLS